MTQYVLDTLIYDEKGLYAAISNKKGVTICRAEAPTSEDLAEWGAALLSSNDKPVADIVKTTNTAIKNDAGEWVRYYDARPYTEQEVVLKIQEKRNEVIKAGVVFNNVLFDADDRSLARLANAAIQALTDNTYTANWKTNGVFYSLSASDILAANQAVRSHVQACFDRESELLNLKDSDGNPVTPTKSEILANWPVRGN